MNAWDTHQHYQYFSEKFVSLADQFKKPILYMQGNHHCWTNDNPYKKAPNIQRIVVDKVETAPFVRITVKGDNFQIDRRKNKKLDYFIKDAASGDVWSQYFLGKEYFKAHDYLNGKKWFVRASDKGFAPAKVELGRLLKKEKNYDQAFKLFQSVANINKFDGNNSPQDIVKKSQNFSYANRIRDFKNKIMGRTTVLADYQLGSMYYAGYGRPRDYNKALEYFEKAGDKGNVEARYNLAGMYYKGIGIKRDIKKAIYWYNKAASSGVSKAKFILGVIYLQGEGVKQDYKEAAKWFKLSGNNRSSLFNLGVLYFNGLGVKQDQKVAIDYFKSAAMAGSQEAKKILENLKKIPMSQKSTTP